MSLVQALSFRRFVVAILGIALFLALGGGALLRLVTSAGTL